LGRAVKAETLDPLTSSALPFLGAEAGRELDVALRFPPPSKTVKDDSGPHWRRDFGDRIVTNRREFLRTAAALSAAPLAGRAAFAGERGTALLEAVICDARYSDARRLAARAGRLGASVRSIEGDITDLWSSELL